MEHPTCAICGHSLMTNGYCPNHRCENHPKPEGGVSLAEMNKVYPRLSLFDGRQWGNWKLHAQNLTLVYPQYEIDLESITDSAARLDWIFQLS